MRKRSISSCVQTSAHKTNSSYHTYSHQPDSLLLGPPAAVWSLCLVGAFVFGFPLGFCLGNSTVTDCACVCVRVCALGARKERERNRRRWLRKVRREWREDRLRTELRALSHYITLSQSESQCEGMHIRNTTAHSHMR